MTCCMFTPRRPAKRRKEASKTSTARSQSTRRESRTIRRLRTHSMVDQNTYTPTINTVSDTRVTTLRLANTRSKAFHM